FHAYKLYSLPPPRAEISDPRHQRLSCDQHLANHSVYSGLATTYDQDVGTDEWLMGLQRRRRKAVELCEGAVLETAAGTGRNLALFADNKAVSSLTLTDASAPMLQVAFSVAKELVAKNALPPLSFSVLDLDNDAALTASSSSNMSKPKLNAYDSVIDTFGLCSVADPSKALANMRDMLKPGGKLILLEHGRTQSPIWGNWINAALDKTAQMHADKWGCWWNRDLESFVRGVPGLEIECVTRYHFGTTIEVIARRCAA
ncbi:S-adenosyl-L-methionine-dependent methyltransferase, partial [Chytriomyces sp. MP71]